MVIRPARPDDVSEVLRLIRALAAYEREPAAVQTTTEDLAEALFGPAPLAHAHVADDDGQVVGMALWFLAFSTWKGRPTLYLEDLFVEPDRRGGGLGAALMAALAEQATQLGCARMEWSVLNWNEPAIGFYRTLGAQPMQQWTTWRLDLPLLS